MRVPNTDAPHLRDGHVSTVVGLRNIPEAIRSLDTFDNPDYVDLSTVTTRGATDKSPEQWARAVLEGTPLGQSARPIWRLLGLRPGPRHSPACAGRPGRLPSARAAGSLARPVAESLPRCQHALRDPVEARRAARLGQAERWRRLQGADAPRPVAGGFARRPFGPGLRRASLRSAVPARGRVGCGDRQPDHARG